MKTDKKYVIKNIKNNTYYRRTPFKGQKHFVKFIGEARVMNYNNALKVYENLKCKDNYIIKEVKY